MTMTRHYFDLRPDTPLRITLPDGRFVLLSAEAIRSNRVAIKVDGDPTVLVLRGELAGMKAGEVT